MVFWAKFMLSMPSLDQIKEGSIDVSSTGIEEEAAKISALRLAIDQARNQPKTVTYNDIIWR